MSRFTKAFSQACAVVIAACLVALAVFVMASIGICCWNLAMWSMGL